MTRLADRVPTRTANCQVEHLGEETLVFCPAATEVIYLDHAAALVWTLCDGTRTVAQIVDLLAGAYPEAAGRMAGDVDQTLRRLQERGAIHLA